MLWQLGQILSVGSRSVSRLRRKGMALSDALGFMRSLERPYLMAILYAYFDESGKKGDHPVVTFSGLLISDPKLRSFDDAWNALLRQYEIPYLHMTKASRLKENNGPHMPRHQKIEDRMKALHPFSDCINQHFELGISQAYDVEGFTKLRDAARSGVGSPPDPYYLAFTRGLLEIVDHTNDGDRLSLICDDDLETAWECYGHYREIRKAMPKVREKTAALSFADDRYFPALQASDMFAFLSRLAARKAFYKDYFPFEPLHRHLTKDRGAPYTKWGFVSADKNKLIELGMELGKIRPPKKRKHAH